MRPTGAGVATTNVESDWRKFQIGQLTKKAAKFAAFLSSEGAQLIASFTALLSGCTLASLSVSTPFSSLASLLATSMSCGSS